MNDFHRDPGFADALASGALSRRELIQRGTALGIGAAGIAGMLVAADKADASDLRVAQGLAGGTVNLLIPGRGRAARRPGQDRRHEEDTRRQRQDDGARSRAR